MNSTELKRRIEDLVAKSPDPRFTKLVKDVAQRLYDGDPAAERRLEELEAEVVRRLVAEVEKGRAAAEKIIEEGRAEARMRLLKERIRGLGPLQSDMLTELLEAGDIDRVENVLNLLDAERAERKQRRESEPAIDMQYRGEWKPDTKYPEGSVVFHQGVLWIALRDTEAEPALAIFDIAEVMSRAAPTDRDWKMLSGGGGGGGGGSAGPTGAAGATGPAGPAGADGSGGGASAGVGAIDNGVPSTMLFMDPADGGTWAAHHFGTAAVSGGTP